MNTCNNLLIVTIFLFLTLTTNSYSTTYKEKVDRFNKALMDMVLILNKDKIDILKLRFKSELPVITPMHFKVEDLFSVKMDILSIFSAMDVSCRYLKALTMEMTNKTEPELVSTFFVGLQIESINSPFVNLPFTCDLFNIIHTRNRRLTRNPFASPSATFDNFTTFTANFINSEFINTYLKVDKLLELKKTQLIDKSFNCSGLITPILNLKIPNAVEILRNEAHLQLHKFFSFRPEFSKDRESEVLLTYAKFIDSARNLFQPSKPQLVTPTQSKLKLIDKTKISKFKPVFQIPIYVSRSKTYIPVFTQLHPYPFIKWIYESAFQLSTLSIQQINGYIEPIHPQPQTTRPTRFYEFVPTNLLPSERKKDTSNFLSEFVNELFYEVEGKSNTLIVSLLLDSTLTPFLELMNSDAFDSYDQASAFNKVTEIFELNRIQRETSTSDLDKSKPYIVLESCLSDLSDYIKLKFSQYGVDLLPSQKALTATNKLEIDKLCVSVNSIIQIKAKDLDRLKQTSNIFSEIKKEHEQLTKKYVDLTKFNSLCSAPFWILDRPSRIKFLLVDKLYDTFKELQFTKVKFDSSWIPIFINPRTIVTPSIDQAEVTKTLSILKAACHIPATLLSKLNLINELNNSHKQPLTINDLKISNFRGNFLMACTSELNPLEIDSMRQSDKDLLIFKDETIIKYHEYLDKWKISKDKTESTLKAILRSMPSTYPAFRAQISQDLYDFKRNRTPISKLSESVKLYKTKLQSALELAGYGAVDNFITPSELYTKKEQIRSLLHFISLLQSNSQTESPIPSLIKNRASKVSTSFIVNPSVTHLAKTEPFRLHQSYSAHALPQSMDHSPITSVKQTISQIKDKVLRISALTQNSYFDDLTSDELVTQTQLKTKLPDDIDLKERIYNGFINSPISQYNANSDLDLAYVKSLSYFHQHKTHNPLKLNGGAPNFLNQIKVLVQNVKSMYDQREQALSAVSSLKKMDSSLSANIWCENIQLVACNENSDAKVNKLILCIKQIFTKTIFKTITDVLKNQTSQAFVSKLQDKVNKLKEIEAIDISKLKELFDSFTSRQQYTLDQLKLDFLKKNKGVYNMRELFTKIYNEGVTLVNSLAQQERSHVKQNNLHQQIQTKIKKDEALKIQFNLDFITALNSQYQHTKPIVALNNLKQHKLITTFIKALDDNSITQNSNLQTMLQLDIFKDDDNAIIELNKLIQIQTKNEVILKTIEVIIQKNEMILYSDMFKTYGEAVIAYDNSGGVTQQNVLVEVQSDIDLRPILSIKFDEKYDVFKHIITDVCDAVEIAAQNSVVLYDHITHNTILQDCGTGFKVVETKLDEINLSLNSKDFELNQVKFSEIISSTKNPEALKQLNQKYSCVIKFYEALKDLSKLKVYTQIIAKHSTKIKNNCEKIDSYLEDFAVDGEQSTEIANTTSISSNYTVLKNTENVRVSDISNDHEFTKLFDPDVIAYIKQPILNE